MRLMRWYPYVFTLVVAIAIGVQLRSDTSNKDGSNLAQPAELTQANPLARFPTNTLELRNLTWVELRDRISNGFARVIIPTGGIEQNGPFVVLGKHDLIVHAVSLKVAAELGKTIVAPTISFVPEGSLSPPSMHMRYPGTISLADETFQALLEDTIMSLAGGGFREIVVLGDSGPSQAVMEKAAHSLDRAPRAKGVRVIFVPEFYNYASIRQLLLDRGIRETPENFHEELAFSLQLLVIDPVALRFNERLSAGYPMLGGVDLNEREKLTQLGKDIISKRVADTSAAIRARLAN